MTSGRKRGDKNKYSDETLEQYCLRAYAYNPDTGAFTRKIAPRAGAAAGLLDSKGYRRVQFRNHSLRIHRIAWFLHFGAWPEGLVDHINRNPADNRIKNLRIVTSKQNTWNQKARPNKTGFKGVTKPSPNRWLARINTPKGRVEIGYFKTAEEAALAYDAAAIKHHGKFAATNAELGLLKEFLARRAT